MASSRVPCLCTAVRAFEALSLLESAPRTARLRRSQRPQQRNSPMNRHYASTARRSLAAPTRRPKRPVQRSSQPPSSPSIPLSKPSKPLHHSPPPPPTFNPPKQINLTGRVTRVGTMRKTVSVTRPAQTFDPWLQKHYTRPSRSLVHDAHSVLVEGDVIKYGIFEPGERRARIDAKRGLQVKYELKGVVTPFGIPLEKRQAWRRSPEGRGAMLAALQARQAELDGLLAQTVADVADVGAVARQEALEEVRESARRAVREAEGIERDAEWRVLFNNVFGMPRPLTRPEQRASAKLGGGVLVAVKRGEELGLGEVPRRVRERAGLR